MPPMPSSGQRYVLVSLVSLVFGMGMRRRLMWIGMQHSGLGGGGFMLVRDSQGKYESIGTFHYGLQGSLILNCR
jgi:hypothetical protein